MPSLPNSKVTHPLNSLSLPSLANRRLASEWFVLDGNLK